MGVPVLTDEQRRVALEKAVAARVKRASLCDDLTSGKITLVQILDMADDPEIGRLKVSAVIQALPKYGVAKTAKLMEELHIAQSRRIRGLGRRQREALLERLSQEPFLSEYLQ